MSEMSESMGKAFGGAGGDSGGMITESGMSGGGGGDGAASAVEDRADPEPGRSLGDI